MRMLIALVSDEYPPAIIRGGIGTYSKALAELLAKSGEHEVHVFCQRDAIEKRSAGEYIHEVAGLSPRSRPARILYFRLIAPLLGSIEHRVRWGIAVGRAVLATENRLGRRFDVIEVPEAGGIGSLLRLAGVKTAMLVRLHTSTAILRRHAQQRQTLQDLLVGFLEKRSIKKGDLVTSPTRALIRESLNDLGLKELDCVVYPNLQPPVTAGTDCAPRADSNRPSVLVVGRLGRYKGTDLVLQAVGRLQSQGFPGLRLVLIGRSEWSRADLQAMVARALRPGTCEILGEVDHQEALSAMRGATMLVQASRYDNYPNTILEALLSGCLVVGSNVGGIPEIVTHRRSGLLFNSGDADSLVTEIRWALEHPAESAEMAREGTMWVHAELADAKLLKAVMSAYQRTQEHAARRRPTSVQRVRERVT